MPDPNTPAVGEAADAVNVEQSQTVSDDVVAQELKELANLRKELAQAKEAGTAKEVSTANEVIVERARAEKSQLEAELAAIRSVAQAENNSVDTSDTVDPQLLASPHLSDDFKPLEEGAVDDIDVTVPGELDKLLSENTTEKADIVDDEKSEDSEDDSSDDDKSDDSDNDPTDNNDTGDSGAASNPGLFRGFK